MKNRFLLTLVFMVTFLLRQDVSALQITEIMYDPVGSDTGSEWIELYNETGISIVLSSYKFFENNTNHAIAPHVGGSSNVESGEYVVLADNPVNFLNAHPGYAGKLFDSTFSLSNTGEYIEVRDASGANLSSVNYIVKSDSNGTGGTLNYIDSLWQVFTETPGAVSTQNSVAGTATTTGTTTVVTSSYNTGYSSRTYSLGDLSMLVPKEIYTVAGGSTYFFIKPLDSKKNIVPSSTYWSFGDGASGTGATTTHKYYSPGLYTAFVESEIVNSYGIERIRVIVASPDISISEVGDNYIVIKNSSDEELNIGGFIVAGDQGFFKLSRQLVIKAGSDLKLDGRAAGFPKLTNPKILAPDMTNISIYQSGALHTAVVQASLAAASSTPKNKIVTLPSTNKKDITRINKNNLNTIEMGSTSKTVYIPPIKKNKNWLYWLYE